MADYTYNDLQNELLNTITTYFDKNKLAKPKINYGEVRFIGDAREETILEKSIRNLESENEMGISANTIHNKDEICEQIIDTNIINNENHKYHAGYLHYLLCAWKNHHGIEIGPWHLWNIFLWNIKEFNRFDPQRYAKLWTTNTPTDKISIQLVQNKFDMKLVIDALKQHIPNDTINTLLLDFDTNPEYYMESLYGLIGEISQDYYSVSILACGIPTVKVLGTKEQWDQLNSQFQKVKTLYSSTRTTIMDKYFHKVEQYFQECAYHYNNESYWKGLFSVKKCGSGSQQEIEGHMSNMFINTILIEKLPKIVSNFGFNTITINNQVIPSRYISGVMSSELIDNILVPKFGYWSTQIDLNDYQITPNQKTHNAELINAMKILNSFGRPPIYHRPTSESYFGEKLNESSVVIGKVTLDSYIDYTKKRNPNLDIERTKENFTREIEKHKGKNSFEYMMSIVTDIPSNKSNFWYANKQSTESTIIIATDDWLKGRKRMNSNDIKLICNNFNPIADYLIDQNRHWNHDIIHQLSRIILPCYHEDVYKCYMDYMQKYLDVSKEDAVFEIINFLFSNCAINGENLITKNRNGIHHGVIFGLPYHTVTIAILLTKQLNIVDTELCENIFNRYVDQLYRHLDVGQCLYPIKNTKRDHFAIINPKNIMDIMELINIFLGKNTDATCNHLMQKILNFSWAFDQHKHKNDMFNVAFNKLSLSLKIESEQLEYGSRDILKHNDIPLSENLLSFIEKIQHFTNNFNHHIINNYHNDNKIDNTIQNYWFYGEIVKNNPTEPSYFEKEKKLTNWISLDRYQNKITKQMEFFGECITKDNFDEIYKFLQQNDKNGYAFTRYIFWTLNPEIYEMFISKYKSNPYEIKWNVDDYCNSTTNIKVNSEAELVEYVLCLINNKRKYCRLMDKEIRKIIFKEMCVKYKDIMSQICDSLNEKIKECAPKSIDEPYLNSSENEVKLWKNTVGKIGKYIL